MLSYFFQQIVYAGPVLLVYLIGVVVSIIFLRQHPVPSLLALCGLLILFLTGVFILVAQGYLVRLRVEAAWTIARYSQMSMVITIVGTVFRTLGSALVVAAIFTGRKNRVISQTG